MAWRESDEGVSDEVTVTKYRRDDYISSRERVKE